VSRSWFHGVKGSRTRYALHTAGQILILSPAILVCAASLVIHRRRVGMVGRLSPVISCFIPPLEALLRSVSVEERRDWLILNMSRTDNHFVEQVYGRAVRILGSREKWRRSSYLWAARLTHRLYELLEAKSDPAWMSRRHVIQLRRSETDAAWENLARLGIDRDRPYVLVVSRHNAYYERLAREGVVVKGRAVRNPREETYLEAALAFAASEKAQVVRIGRDMPPLASSWTARGVVDYAGVGRTDEMDVVLASEAWFMLNGATGAFWLTEMFHRTQVHGDVYDARHVQIDGSIFTLQRVRDVATGRLLTLREMLLHESRYSDERHMERLGLELVKNTRADLLGAMAEMVERLAGRWVDDPERVHRQATYRAIVAEYSSEPTWMGRGWPSDRFLIDNPDLLE